jgi:hypothetical protein
MPNFRGTGSRGDRPVGGTVVGPARRPHALQGGHAIPYARRSGDDRVEAAWRQQDSEENDADTHTRIARVVDRLILQVGAAETLRLLMTLSQDAPEVGREPFAAARPTYESSFSGTGADGPVRRRTRSEASRADFPTLFESRFSSCCVQRAVVRFFLSAGSGRFVDRADRAGPRQAPWSQ